MSQVRAAVTPPVGVDVPVPAGAWIRVMRGFYEGLELPVDRAWWVIGRGRGADAVLAEPTISRAHVAIGYQPDEGFFVQDLGSTNGTLLNGARTQRAVLADGDELRMGKLELRVGVPGAPS
jgi:pSer/pThr/pTyr-binding forkhead associated (FHA) protein